MSAEYFFVFLNAYYPNTHLIQFFNFVDSSKPYGRLLENQKTGGSKELFLLCRTFDAYRPNKDVKLRPKSCQIALAKWAQ